MREWLKKIWCPQDTCGALIIVTGLYFTFYNFADILLILYIVCDSMKKMQGIVMYSTIG